MTQSLMPPLSQVFSDLTKVYASHDMRILGSVSPYVVSGEQSASTFVARGQTVLSTSGGIAADEMAFSYGLCEVVRPKRILVVGNSYGISTVFFALANPEASIIAMDKFRTVGLSVTNELLAAVRGPESPPALALQASTPHDLADVVADHLGGTVDLVFVDAVHENEVQSAEFRVLEPLLSRQGAVLFHDVISCGLMPSIEELKVDFPRHEFVVCARTSTGVGVASASGNSDLQDYLAFWALDAREVLDFDELMRARWGEPRAGFFGAVSTAMAFPPHPQL